MDQDTKSKLDAETMPKGTVLSFSGVPDIAAALHGSLKLSEIIGSCLQVIWEHLGIGRLSLVQHRANETTVAVFSMDGEREVPINGPKIITLEPSRLSQCISQKDVIHVRFQDPSAQDAVERGYLLHPESAAAIYLPLVLNDKLKGVLVVDVPSGRELAPLQNAFLKHVADHLALSLENSDIHYMERRRARQLGIVSDIAKQAVVIEHLAEFLSTLSESLRKGFDYDVVEIWTAEERQEELFLRICATKAPRSPVAEETVPKMVAECRRLNRILCNNNLLAEPPTEPGHEGIASQLAVPIRLRGRLLGVLSLESSRLDAFSADDFNVMEGVASVIASTFDNLRVFANVQQANQYMQAILQSAKGLAILWTDIHGYVITSSTGTHSIFHLSPEEILAKDILSLFTNEEFQRDLAVFINAPKTLTLERTKIAQGDKQSPSYLNVTVQLVVDAGEYPIGFLCIARDVTETVLLQQTLEKLSVTDELTGLYNQRFFFSALAAEIERARRFRRRFSLCFFDLDGFKQFNDTHGHLQGDQAIKDAANLIRSDLRAHVDTCFRYGGDEFTILMPETTKAQARIVTDRVRLKLCRFFHGEITASIGIAESSPDGGAERVIDKADAAMYQAKAKGGNCIVLAD